MRVLWVTNMWPDEARPWYGSFVYSQAKSLRRLDVELDVVYIRGYRGSSEYLRAIGALHRASYRTRYDVIHAHYGHSAVVARLQAAAPLVISYCGDDLLGTPVDEVTRRQSRTSQILAAGFAQLSRIAAATITKSEAMASKLPTSARRRNHVIPNGVDLAQFAPMDPVEARRRVGWPEDPPSVLFVGNPAIPRKNLRLAREVCAEVTRRGQPVELRIGWDIAPADIPLWMNAAHTLLFTSLSEGSPNTVKEAMAVALPIVSAPVGDVPERLSNVPGTFIVDHDVSAMATAVMQALSIKRAPAARAAIEMLSDARIAQRVLGVYRTVAS